MRTRTRAGRTAGLGLGAVACLALAACGGSAGGGGGAPAQRVTAELVVGVKGDPFYVTMAKGAMAEAARMGVDLTVDGPAQFDPVQQTPIVDAVIARKVNVLIIAPTDKQAMIAPLQRASEAGIKVITVDTFVGNGDYVNGPVRFPLSYIGSDNVQGGVIGCQAIVKAIGGQGKVYIQNVKPGISTTDQREQGCKQALQAAGGGVSLVGVDYNNDSAATAAQQTGAVLQRTPDLKGIFGTNLFSAEGAAQAVQNAHLTGTVKIANFDAPEQAITDLKKGVNDIVIAQEPAMMGKIAVDYAVDAMTGRSGEIQHRVPTGYVVITRDNVNSPEAQAAIYKSA